MHYSSKESLGSRNVDNPLNALFTFGLFLTSQALSILNAPFAGDPTMQYLYNLALNREENCSNNVPLSLFESEDLECEKLLALANTTGSSDVLVQAISDATAKNDGLIKKHVSDPSGTFLNKRTTKTNPSSSIDNDKYIKDMGSVENFKQERIQKGHTKMDWTTCWEEGSRLRLLDYKNPNALRNQFSKYMKQKKESKVNILQKTTLINSL